METWFQQFPLEKQELLPLFCNYSPPYKDWHKRSDFSQAWCKKWPKKRSIYVYTRSP
jgi:hypothetical protein